MSERITCPICSETMEAVFSGKVLNKFNVAYYNCNNCGLLKTEHPYWLEEAYKTAIADSDTGLVSRNIHNSALLETILEFLQLQDGRFVDVAGGYGLLTRLMRDKGFDCYSTDKYCPNLFAKTFEPDDEFKADALFAFEVLEHIEDPVEFLDGIIRRYDCKTIIFSTLTYEDSVPDRDWWYYSFAAGQHITFYQPKTLTYLAEHFSCRYYRLDPSTHLITDMNLPIFSRFIIFNKYFRFLYSCYLRMKRRGLSRTWADHLIMEEQLKSD